MTYKRAVFATVAATALAFSAAAPADAARDTFTDRAGDLKGGMDIRSVQVKNNQKLIRIRSTHRNLKYGPHSPHVSVAFFIDTIRDRKGPEFRLAGPIGFDGDYALVKMRGWKRVIDDTRGPGLPCRVSFTANYRTEAVRMSVRPVCLANAFDHAVGKVRVSVQATQARKGPGSGHDWAPRRHRFYPAVTRG